MVSGPDVAHAINDPENAVARLVAAEADNRQVVEQIYWRVLGRPATEEEISIALSELAMIADDHQQLMSARDARQEIVAVQIPLLEQQRTAAIAETTARLDARIAEVDPTLLEKEAAHEKAIVDARQALEAYETSDQGLAGWQRRQLTEVHWSPAVVTAFESGVGRTARVLGDRSLLVSGNKGKDVYSVTTSTDVAGITAVRLEMLPDESLGGKGPGLAKNGNLVLTELQMEIAHPERPDEWQPVAFASAVANFEQASYPVTAAIDGVTDNNTGWALMGRTGKPNWAVFALKVPVGYANGSLVRFRLYQAYDDEHQVGRFRISLTRYDQPVGLGLDESLAAGLLSDEASHSEETKVALREAFRRSDPRYAELDAADKAAQKPLQVDAGIVELREKLKRVSLPLPPDSILARLNADVETSARQLANERLTAAQDLTWALINSPAFLFNR
jgi:hypothetical protein